MAQRFINFSTLSNSKFPSYIADLMSSQSLIDSSLARSQTKDSTVFFRPTSNSWTRIPLIANKEQYEILVCFRLLTPANAAYSNTGCGIYAGDMANSNFYGFASGIFTIGSINYVSALSMSKSSDGTRLSGSDNALRSVTAQNSTQLFKYIRVRKNGSTYQYKGWWSDESEPSNWMYTTTDTQWGGKYSGLLLHGYGINVEVRFASIGTDGDVAPLSLENRRVDGFAYNPDNTAYVNNAVRLYLKETGKLLEDTLTDNFGAYAFSIPVYEDQLVQIVGVDHDNNEWKPPIHEAYPVL